ncbi:MAG: hypothetical protein ABR606_10645, partial [Vicinamibacterales bacterium]
RSTFAAGTPRALFEGRYSFQLGRPYDVSPDGQRFLMLEDTASAAPPAVASPFVVVLNWFEELARLAPPR